MMLSYIRIPIGQRLRCNCGRLFLGGAKRSLHGHPLGTQQIWRINTEAKDRSTGQYKVAAHELDFDIWRLEDTWAVRHFALPHTIQSFVQTPFLNIDSIAMSIGPGTDYLAVFEHGFFEALKRRYVEVNQTDNPYPVLCAVRGLIMAATLNFVVGPKLAAFVYELAQC